MNYGKVIRGEFISRPNRFIAHVNIGGEETVVHVKNTGRCRELLLPGAEVYLEEASNPNRKTKYDLIAVRKSNGVLFNIDSQAPNAVVKEWLERQNIARIVPEYRYGDSKGCTLERGGIGYFPDAPTERGVRHLHELMKARKEGYDAAIAFVMQADGMKTVLPNDETHPAFGKALREAQAAGVKVLDLPCHVEPDSLEIWET